MDKEVIMYLEAQKMAVRVALRDHFAGLAMQALITRAEERPDTMESINELTDLAVFYGAAMLRAREAS